MNWWDIPHTKPDDCLFVCETTHRQMIAPAFSSEDGIQATR